ncbi:hyphal growth and polarity protein HbrB [Histoplasma ohiense]|nr:hyphal growth and polarity protein HbrB [Histoplasma ohiense (nom. inval.)]
MSNRSPVLRRADVILPMPLDSPNPLAANDHSVRPGSSSSDTSSNSSNLTSLNLPKRTLYGVKPSITSPRKPSASANNSNTSLPNFSRPSAPHMSPNDPLSEKALPLPPPPEFQNHRPRQHSQGFFEPSLPTASLSEQTPVTMANLSASQIAAQAAMQHQASSRHLRNRSQPSRLPQDNVARKGSKEHIHHSPSGEKYSNGLVGGRALAATTAANVAFPRSPGFVPSSPNVDYTSSESGHKQKGEKSKIKIFSKPKHIGLSRDKDGDKNKALQSPNNHLPLPGPSGLSRMVNASASSLNESSTSANSSMYNLTNSSATTVVLADRPATGEREKDRDKDKAHKHHFLSRQKLKLKDKDDHFNLSLSSASSNSKPLDPSAPQSLYSFTPQSPSTTAFAKSKSGLDLRHGGRALREKKKEEKASAAAAHEIGHRDTDERTINGALCTSSSSVYGGSGNTAPNVYGGETSLKETLQGFGLHNMAPEDAWDFLKAKLLVLFEGEDVRVALEDLNKLVSIHIQQCVMKHIPSVVVEDLRDLLQTGFSSLSYSLHPAPDECVVPHLVEMWVLVFGVVLPFIQAVFLPLDLEFKGRGSIMTPREAKEFWGALPNGESSNRSMGDELDVRTIVLISFRDNVIIPRYEMLKTTFSRLSLETIHVNVRALSTTPTSRPSTASALDSGFGSYNSQSSTLLSAAGSFSSDSVVASMSRSRAASNTSNPEYVSTSSYTSMSPPQGSTLNPTLQSLPLRTTSTSADPSHLITETAGRMLQCISVLASVQTDDEAQEKIDTLRKALKHNWLGRGRTGRDRRGFVGTKIRAVVPRKESDDTPPRFLPSGNENNGGDD